MAVTITLNGQSRDLELLPGCTLLDLLAYLQLKVDQVALEQNGQIVRRNQWPETPLVNGDRLEIVQFVGGGGPVNSVSTGGAVPPSDRHSHSSRPGL